MAWGEVNTMNQHIEVINDHLMAVKFSYIPFIKEIDYRPDNEIPMFEEPGRISTNGTLLLNKDYTGYAIIKSMYPEVMRKSDKRIQKELISAVRIREKTPRQIIYISMLELEKERRGKEKWWKEHGHIKNSNSSL